MIKTCKRCKRKRVIEAKGLCKSCYVYKQVMKTPESRRKFKERCRRWREKNKDYYKEYRKKNSRYWRNYQRRKLDIPEERWKKS